MEGSRESAGRVAKLALSMTVALALVGCGGLGLLPYQTDIQTTNFKSYQAVEAAYKEITPGETPASDLEKIGFDSTRAPNVEILSYLGVIERFMPRDSISFDNLDPAVQSCIEARDRCTAYVFHPGQLHQQRTGSLLLDLFGFERTTVSTGWQAEVVFLVQDGRVAYKVMSGKPNIDTSHDTVQPLGPLQDIGDTVVRTASRVL
jgi:hypothetical protein